MAVLEQDDEFRTMKLMHRSLMKLPATARRRVVRYIVERHLTNEEPEVRIELKIRDELTPALSEVESIAEAKAAVLGTSAQ